MTTFAAPRNGPHDPGDEGGAPEVALEVTPLHPEDVAAVDALRPADWRDLGPIHRFYLDHPACHPMKATRGGRIVGAGTAIDFGGTGWLSHIVVGGDFRNQGIGGFITDALVRFLTGPRGCSTVSLIATDLGYPVYARRGFTVRAEYAIVSAERPASPSPRPDRLRPLAAGDWPRVFDLDRRMSGEERSSILRRFPEGALVFESDGRVEGFYLPGLGEGLIVADHATAGLALLGERIDRPPSPDPAGGAVSVVLPVDNPAAREFLVARGFRETKRVRRMIRGAPLDWNPELLFNRIAGNLG